MLLTINATRPYRECYLATCQPSYREQRLIFSLNVALTGLSDVTPETLRRRRAQIICVQKHELKFMLPPNQRPARVAEARFFVRTIFVVRVTAKDMDLLRDSEITK